MSAEYKGSLPPVGWEPFNGVEKHDYDKDVTAKNREKSIERGVMLIPKAAGIDVPLLRRDVNPPASHFPQLAAESFNESFVGTNPDFQARG